MSLVDQVKQAGVVGAGGGGFPAHVKLSAQADTLIANGAECEPLLHKDAAIMEHYAEALVQGMELSMDVLGAQTGIIGIKAKKKRALDTLQRVTRGSRIRIHLLGDYYPAGDEYDLVYEVTGRLIPPAGIPIHAGVVVHNVETLLNIAAAAQGKPLTRKFVTIAGAVRRPLTLHAPLGIPWRDCIEAAGGLVTNQPVLAIGGLMMGQISEDLDAPVTKTSTGVIVLPREHPYMRRKLKPTRDRAFIGKSACDQCRYCTEYCPRFLLGYAVEPHQVMRSLAFTATGAEYWNQWATLCCSCALCTLFACPEELYPKEACDDSKIAMKRLNRKWSGSAEIKTHPMRDGRRVPIKTLAKRLHVLDYEHDALFEGATIHPKRLTLPLKQSAGLPCEAKVKPGQNVSEGQLVAEPAEGALGAPIHAPLQASVVEITANEIILKT